MPPARRSSTTKPAARSAGKSTTRSANGTATRATRSVRARAASTSAATRREVEQSIARFEKRLDDANDALKTLGKHLGRGAQSSYKEVTAALTALRREAAKTNKQALKDFDKIRSAITQSRAPSARESTPVEGEHDERLDERARRRLARGRPQRARARPHHVRRHHAPRRSRSTASRSTREDRASASPFTRASSRRRSASAPATRAQPLRAQPRPRRR